MDEYENPAVVIGGTENGVGIIRNLGRNGIDVYCVVDKKDVAVYSKYCKEYFVFPGVTYDLLKLKTFLTKFKQRLTCRAVLFPTSDISTLNVSRLMSEISDYYLAPISDQKVLETLIEKRSFYCSLLKKRVPHPLTLFPELENLKNISAKTAFPVFVKPSMSQIFSKIFRKKGFVANSNQELHRYLSLMQKYDLDVMVQEIVPGPAQNHYLIDGYFNLNSKPVALFARRRLRMWPPSFGNSTLCVSVPISEVLDMKEIVVKYLESLGFRGIFSAEFKVDSRSNIAKLLEVNARSWGGGGINNTFPSACGVNIILTAYLDVLEKEVKIREEYEVGTYGIHFVLNSLSLLSEMVTQRKFSLKEWISPMRGRKHWTVLAKDDMRPFLMYTSLEIFHKIHKNLSVRHNLD